MYPNGVSRLCLVVGLGLVAAACSSMPAGEPATTLAVEVNEFAFAPAALEVTASQPVELVLTNKGALAHDFSILEFPTEDTARPAGGVDHDMGAVEALPDVHAAAAAEQSARLPFTPTKPGAYEFFCTVEGRQAAGMTGTLVVTAP